MLKNFIWILFFTVVFSLTSQSVNANSTQEIESEKWLDEIVEDLFLNNTMVYTLFGTKPMSAIAKCIATKSECIKSWQPYLETLDEKKRSDFLKNLHEYLDSNSFIANYPKWLELRKKNPSSQFFIRTSLSENKYYLIIDMINPQETLWTLQKHYLLFSKETQMEFDPVKKVLEFENPDSVFWNKVFQNTYLIGILFGYGERNAYLYSLYSEEEFPHKQLFFGSHLNSQRKNEDTDDEISIKNIGLPPFRSFTPFYIEDPILTHFKVERESIQKHLKDKNFTKEALKQFFGKDIALEKTPPQSLQN